MNAMMSAMMNAMKLVVARTAVALVARLNEARPKLLRRTAYYAGRGVRASRYLGKKAGALTKELKESFSEGASDPERRA